MAADLLPLEEAQARLLALARRAPPVARPLIEAAGGWLAADVAARLTQPSADVSAMDGWAVRLADLPGPLAVIGTSAAGAPFAGVVSPGAAVRIFTGAHLPDGADTVAVQEEMEEADGRVRLTGAGPGASGRHVRRMGQDFMAGDAVGRAGDRLSAARVGLLAAAGLAQVPVWPPPRVALLATGSELVPPGVAPGAGQIVSSNALMLAALLAGEGVAAMDLGIVRDDAGELERALYAAAREADLLVTIGGASVGEHDLVRPALARLGATIDFWRVAIRPGKPLLAGRLGDRVVLGLPGNPVSAFVCAMLFLLPLVRHMMGARDPYPVPVKARCAAELPANGPRRDFMRARLETVGNEAWIRPAPVQDSAMLGVLADANALLIRAENAPAAAPGSEVMLLRL
jgi:molybdopterin molybdotransferase